MYSALTALLAIVLNFLPHIPSNNLVFTRNLHSSFGVVTVLWVTRSRAFVCIIAWIYLFSVLKSLVDVHL